MRRATAAAERVATQSGTRPYPVTIVLIAINVAVLLAEFAIGGSADGTGNQFFYKGSLFAHGYFDGSPGVADGGWW